MRGPGRDHVDTRHGRMAYLRAGSGPSVVLIHGSLTTADDMTLALFEKLSRDYDVIAFDRPGHGGSEKLMGDQDSPRAQAMATLEAARTLGTADPIVVGHSFGGAVALALALERPDEVAGVVALAPICFPEIRLEHALLGPRALPVFGEAYADWFGRVADVAVLPFMRNAMFLPQIMPPSYLDAFPFAWASQPSAMVADARDGLAEWRTLIWSALNYASCQSRVTILGGTHDIVVANARHGLVAAGMMPFGSFHWVPGAGHMLHHFEQDLVVDAIRSCTAASTRIEREPIQGPHDAASPVQ